MGDSQHDALRVDFDRKIKLEFHGSTVTRDTAGELVARAVFAGISAPEAAIP
jgi:hypothetical protein